MATISGINIKPLSVNERVGRFTHKITVDYTAVAVMTSGTLQALYPGNTLGSATVTVPAGTRVSACAVEVTTAFTFSPGTLVMIIGDDGAADRYFASTTIKTAAWTENTPTTKPYTYGAANTIDIIITAGAGALTSATAGSLDIYLAIEDLNKLSDGI